MTQISTQTALTKSAALRGETVRAVLVGPGSMTRIDFGDETVVVGGKTRAPWQLMVWGAAWRIENEVRVLLTSESTVTELGAMHEILVGQRVERLTLEQPSFSLDVGFDSGLSLRTFALWMDADDDNWMLFMPDGDVVSSAGTQLRLDAESASDRS